MKKFIEKVKNINIKKIINRAKNFIIREIWSVDASKLPKYNRWLVKGIRTFVLAFRGFKEDKVNLRASALTFFSVLSVVPVAAMGFGIAKGFGFEDKLRNMLVEGMKGQEEVANWIINFSENMLMGVNGSAIFGVGIAVLFWTVLKVLGNIENAFNHIWQVRRSRVLFRKFSDYLSILLIAPVLLILSSSIQVFMLEMLDKFAVHIPVLTYLKPLFNLVKYILTWLLFTFVYMVMPNTKVNFGAALLAGIIAGTTFSLLQWGYIHFQVGVSKYNSIYGGFAALPLFLIWMNWSWLIVLLGAEISFSAQNHDQYEFESDIKGLSHYSKNLIALYILHFIIKQFKKEEQPETAPGISEELKLPLRLVRHILYELIECKLIAETPSPVYKETAFLPAVDVHTLSIQSVKERLNSKGGNFKFTEQSQIIEKIENTLGEFKESLLTHKTNLMLQDIT